MSVTETLDERTGEARDRIREATERAETYEAKAAALQGQCLELRRDAGRARAQITALAAYCEAADAVPVAEHSLADAEARFAAAAAHHSECEGRVLQAEQLVRLAADALARAGGSRAQPAELVDLDQRLTSARAVLAHEQQACEEARVAMLQARAPIAARRERVDEAREAAERAWKGRRIRRRRRWRATGTLAGLPGWLSVSAPRGSVRAGVAGSGGLAGRRSGSGGGGAASGGRRCYDCGGPG